MKSLGTDFRKSSYSLNGDCIEIAAPGQVMVRDSKDTGIPGFTVSPAAWRQFATAANDMSWR